jgi:hypothetical protein
VTLAPEYYYSVIAGLDPVIYNSLFCNIFLRRDQLQAWERKMPASSAGMTKGVVSSARRNARMAMFSIGYSRSQTLNRTAMRRARA